MSGLNVLNETLPKKALQQWWVDLNANNMAWSENNDLNAHSKAQSKNEEEEQGEE